MKRLVCILLLSALLLINTGCHGATEQASFQVPQAFDENTPIEITFWSKNESNKNQVAVYKQAIEDFQSLYPNVTVNMKLYTNYGTIYNDVITNISTNTTPNVCITYPDHIATYLTGENTVVPLNQLMDDSRYGFGGSQLRFEGPEKADLVPQFLDECIVSGSYYALPYVRSTEACYVNKDMVEKLGFTLPEVLTWDFVWEVSEAALAKNEDGTFKANGQKVMIPFIYKSTDNMMIQMLRQLEADYSTGKGDILIFNDTTRDLLNTIVKHTQSGAFSTFKISSYPANFLNAGQCIFAVDSTAGATWMGSEAPLIDIADDKLVHFETAVMNVPQFDPENPQMISQGPSVCIFNKENPQEVLASWLFTQYLLTNQVQIAYAQTEGYLPVTTKAQQSQQYQDYLSKAGQDNDTYYDVKIQCSQLLLENLDNTFVTPVFNGSASLRDAAGQMIEEVALSTKRKQVVDDAYIDKLYQDMTSLYRLDSIQTKGKATFGEMPEGSKALLGVLAIAWIGIGAYAFYDNRKRKRK